MRLDTIIELFLCINMINTTERVKEMRIKDSTVAKIQTDFSIIHIQSAALFARQAHAIEEAYDGKFDDRLITEHLAYVTASIITTFSFLEATINKVFTDTKETNNEIYKTLGSQVTERMSEMWDMSLSQSKTLGKFQMALILAEKQKFDKGKTLYQDVDTLRLLRNDLVHYHPKWSQVGLNVNLPPQDEKKFITRLKNKAFTLNPLMSEGNPFYPKRCLSHGCAKWAIESSIKFTDKFFEKLDVKPPYEHVREFLVTK